MTITAKEYLEARAKECQIKLNTEDCESCLFNCAFTNENNIDEHLAEVEKKYPTTNLGYVKKYFPNIPMNEEFGVPSGICPDDLGLKALEYEQCPALMEKDGPCTKCWNLKINIK